MFDNRPRPWDPASGRPSDDQLMDLLRGTLLETAPAIAAGSRVDHGILVGRASWALMALPNHTGRPGHFDVGFVPAVDEPGAQVIPDCISGIGSMNDAVGQVLRIWAHTSGACFLAMVDPAGGHAVHLRGSDPAAVPGWHTIRSEVFGYGADDASSVALQAALAEPATLAAIRPQLDRARHNGIKVYLHRTPTSTTAEVRVNGVPDVTATQTLAALPWPEVAAPSTARFYAVAVVPD